MSTDRDAAPHADMRNPWQRWLEGSKDLEAVGANLKNMRPLTKKIFHSLHFPTRGKDNTHDITSAMVRYHHM